MMMTMVSQQSVVTPEPSNPFESAAETTNDEAAKTTVLRIHDDVNSGSYQQYSEDSRKPLRSVVNTNYPEINEVTTTTPAEHNSGGSEKVRETAVPSESRRNLSPSFTNVQIQTRLLDHLYRFYWRSTQDAFTQRSDDSSSMFHWVWATWAFLASWLVLIQCRFFSPWTISLGGGSQPDYIQSATQQSRDEIFIQNLVHAIEKNDQAGFVRILNDSVDTGRHQTCLNSPVAFTYRGKPVLHYAVRFQRVEMLEILLAHCAEYCVVDKSVPKTDDSDESPTSEVHAYYASLVDDGGNTALHEMARYSAYVDEHMMRLLLAHGCQPTARNMRGYTCAQEALQQNNIKFCLLLCDVWPQAKHKLIQEVVGTAMQVGGNNKRAVAAVLQLLNGLLLVEQLDAATVDALLLSRTSADNASADDEVDEAGGNKLMLLDIDLNRVDAEKPVNILHEALRTGLIVANNELDISRKKHKSGSLPGDIVDDTAQKNQQRLLRLLLRNARVDTNVCDENFIKAQQRLAWHTSSADYDHADQHDSGLFTSHSTTAGDYDDIDAYFSGEPARSSGSRSRTSSSASSHSSSRRNHNFSSENIQNAVSAASQSDLAAYFNPPGQQRQASSSQTAETWAWLHSMCPKLDPLASIAQTRIEFEQHKVKKSAKARDESSQLPNDNRPKTIACTIRLHSHHLVSSVMITPGPLAGAFKAQLFSVMPSSTPTTTNTSTVTKPKKPSSKQPVGELLAEFPTLTFTGSSENPSYRVKYKLSTPARAKHLLLVLTPSPFSTQSASHHRSLKDLIHVHTAPDSSTLLPTDVSVFGLEDNLHRLMFEQLRLGRSQVVELLRNGINTSDTLMHIPRFRLRQLMSKSGCRLPTITRMLDYVDTLAGGDACPIGRIEWLVQPPRIGWEMRDIGAQIVVLTVDETNKWSHITRSVDVELLISSERGGPPIRRITRVDIPRRAILLEQPHVITSPASKTEATTAPPARRVTAEFNDIRLPYGNYKLMARLKRKPKLMAYNPEHVLEIKVAYYGGGGDESILMPPYVGVGGGRPSVTLHSKSKVSYFDRQHDLNANSASHHQSNKSETDSSWLGYVTSWLPGLEGNEADTDSEMYETRARARAATINVSGFQQSSEYALMGTTIS